MRTPDEVAAMRRLHELGWGTRRIAAEIGCNRETVQRYLAADGWAPCRVAARPSLLAGQADWLAERLRRHRGNADVVRQELASELGIVISLRTVERAVSHLRRKLAAEALATVRFTFETARIPPCPAAKSSLAAHRRRSRSPRKGEIASRRA